MIRNRMLALLLLAASTAASAVTLTVTPSAPTTADTLVLDVTDLPPCASPAGDTNTMTDGRVIRVLYNDGANLQCLVAEPRPMRVPLGRLPGGTYRVDLVPVFPANAAPNASVTVTVTNSDGFAPYDDYTGHYVTGVDSEGVFVWQQGSKAFVSYLFLGTDGKPDWLVMPDARWNLGSDGGLRFTGTVWSVERTGQGTAAGQLVRQVGTGSFAGAGLYDRGRLVLDIPGGVDRLLTRMRF